MRSVPPQRNVKQDVNWIIRHRLYGFHVPCVDLDHVLIEFDRARICGFIEHKQAHEPFREDSHSVEAIRDGATRLEVPFMMVRSHYWPWRFEVVPLNEFCKWDGIRRLNERTYAEFLYKLRGGVVPPEVYQDLILYRDHHNPKHVQEITGGKEEEKYS